MTYENISRTISKYGKGTIHTLTYGKALKTRKGVTDTVSKVTTMQCRFGVEYDNMKTTKEGRASGALPMQNAGLAPSLRWVNENFIENINTGAMMLRVANAYGNKTTTKYFRNGVDVERGDIEGLCLASEFSKGTTPSVMNIGIEKIIEIK